LSSIEKSTVPGTVLTHFIEIKEENGVSVISDRPVETRAQRPKMTFGV
jgi:hypothetical protein